MPRTKLQEPRTATAIKDETVEQQAGSNLTDKITVNAAFSGVGAPNAVVRFAIDGKAEATTANADAVGVWTFISTGLADGQHTVVATETDAAGNHGTASLTFSLGIIKSAITQGPGSEETAQQASSDARDKADRLIKMFVDEIKRSNKLTGANRLELRRELRQQYGKKIALEMMLFKGTKQIFDTYSVHPLERNWIKCRPRRDKTIERPGTERDLSELFCVKNSANVTENDVHDIVTMIITQCDPTLTRRDSQHKELRPELQ
ncbi:Ig-like domain-containing protein [Methyloferula stellata]|uniref:Ig-like domain-containing protein n=1 Tax=Methyloferula stellata TaxID=876270 RepID=UPI00036FC2D2|nr:Ig-like domain-containing protein [Methyloferula stellata]